jgi:hypothetical protein
MFQRKDPSKLQAQLEQMTSNGSFNQADGTEWSLTTDKSGNGQARIRFLPAKDDNSTPFVKMYNHGFKTKAGRWFIENCPTTIQACDCPVCKSNSELWNSGIEADKEVARQRKRKLSYYANILVVMDPANPDNNGKVFKYRFGQKIMDKIQAMINVDTDMGETPVDVTCVFDGADFALKTRKKDSFANYDESKFFAQAELPKINDSEFQTFLMEGMHDLNDLVSADKFKTTEEIQTKLNQVLGGAAQGAIPSAQQEIDQFDKDLAAFDNMASTPATTQPVKQAAQSFAPDTNTVDMDDLDSLLDSLD